MAGTLVTVSTAKYDGTPHRSWTAELITRAGDLVELVGVFASDINHPELGSIRKGTISHEYFWLDRWFNVFRFHDPDGTFRNYYCNIIMPPTIQDGLIEYVDLDLDVVVWPDGRQELLDRDEFEHNSIKYGYPIELKVQAEASLAELERSIHKSEFPFDRHQK